mgnify:FL=1|tara:strand:- start:1540 stop:1947 length:408 start_codon:yes stop_codon:yes gene_type:complete
MRSLFESLFTTKDIVRAKYPNGWVGWLNDKMSDDDDGRLTRFSTMDGRYMYIIVERLIDYGFRPPELINDTIHFHDFYLNVYEFRDYAKYDCSKYNSKAPEWLNIQPQPDKKLQEIVELGLDAYAFNGLDYSLNA